MLSGGLLVLLLGVSTFSTSVKDLYYQQSEHSWIRVRDHYIQVELAQTPEEWARGLMFREKLADQEGMLFIGDREEPRSFWMKNTLIPLDILYLDAERRVVRIAERTVPLSEDPIPSVSPAKYVLEIAGGRAAAMDIRLDDQFVFLFKSKAAH